MTDLTFTEIINQLKNLTDRECICTILVELRTLADRIDRHSLTREVEKQTYERDKVEIHNKHDRLETKIIPLEQRIAKIETERGMTGKVATAGLGAMMGAVAGWVTKHF